MRQWARLKASTAAGVALVGPWLVMPQTVSVVVLAVFFTVT